MEEEQSTLLLSRFKSNTNPQTLLIDTTNYLHPFSTYFPLLPPKKTKLPSNITPIKPLRQITKQFLPFISQSLKTIPSLLIKSSNGQGQNESTVVVAVAEALFDVYAVVLNCFECVVPCLEVKECTVELERVRFVRCLMEWGYWKRGMDEVWEVVEGVGGVMEVKVEEGNERFAQLVAECVVCLVKCLYKSEGNDEEEYRRVIELVERVRPWFRILNPKSYTRLQRELASNLYRCALHILDEKDYYTGDLLPKFCLKALKEYLTLDDTDAFFKILHRLCLSLRSRLVNRPSLMAEVLKSVFVPLTCECKDLVPIGSVLRLYSAGVCFPDSSLSRNVDITVCGSLKAILALASFLDNEETLQDLPAVLNSLRNYFHISNKENSYSSLACKSKHGLISLLTYLDALTFFCEPLAESVYRAHKHILAEEESVSLSCNVIYVQDAFHQFIKVFSYSQNFGWESFCCSHDILGQVAVSAFIISLKTGKNIQDSVDCINHIISWEWYQFSYKKALLSYIYNIGVHLYNTEQVEKSSATLVECCKASWKFVWHSCKKFVEELVGLHNNISEEMISTIVAQACERSVVLLNAIHHDVDMSTNFVVTCLFDWAVSKELFEGLNFPTALVRKWVKIKGNYLKKIDSDDDAPLLSSLLFKSPETLSKKTCYIFLEEELIAYEEIESRNVESCRRMQLKLIDLLLIHICDEKAYSLQKSRILIRKARICRARGMEGLNECLQYLLEAILILKDILNEDSSTTASISHQLAITYCLRAICNQEARTTFEVIFYDIQEAIKLWSLISWSRDVHHELMTGDVVPLLCRVADILSLKGYLNFQCEITELIIIFLEEKEVSPKACILMLWEGRRLSHSLCISPISEDIIHKLSQHFGTNYDSIGLWLSFTNDSRHLQIGLRQNFSIYDTTSPQGYWGTSSLVPNVSVDEVKEAASDLALLYAREAFRLRSKLLKSKFLLTNGTRLIKSNLNGLTTHENECDHTHIEVLGRVATEAWPHMTKLWKFEDSVLSQWNILQSYLESSLQVGAIQEAIGDSNSALSYFLHGKEISLLEGLPIFGVAFASALGGIYCKTQQWDLAEKEFICAKNIFEDSCSNISCQQCKLTLEVTIDRQFEDLTRNKYHSSTKTSVFSDVLNSYRSAVKKLKPLELTNSPTLFTITDELEVVNNDNIKPKEPRKLKKAPKHLLRDECFKLETTRMTRSKCRLSDNKSLNFEGQAQCGSTLRSSGNKASSCLDTHIQSGSLMKNNQTLDTELCCDETSACNRSICWTCHVMKVTKTGTWKDLISLRWEIHRRRVLLRIVMDIGKCTEFPIQSHETHKVFGEIMSLLVTVNPFSRSAAALPFSYLLQVIEKQRKGCIFSIERAAILYNLSWFILMNHFQQNPRNTCCDLSGIEISRIVPWLMQSFVLSRELPVLFQKVSRLLATIFVLPTSGGPSLSILSGKALSSLHWASFFHQASVGISFNSQIFSNPNGCLKVGNSTDFVGTYISALPEKVDDLEGFVTDFFKHLQSTTAICISLLGADYNSMLRGIISLNFSSSAWMILSRFKLNYQPVVILLPTESVIEDNDAKSEIDSMVEASTSGRKWRCPWGYSVVDDLAPQFKIIIEESYLSAASLPESRENRMQWWRTRENLDHRLKELLSGIEETWFGPWKCLLLGEPQDCSQLDSVLSELMSDMKCKSEFDAKENLLRIVLGSTESVAEIQACLSQLFPYSSALATCGSSNEFRGFSSTIFQVDNLSGFPHKHLLEAASKLENKCLHREPIILVLDSEVQMLPWENLPILRKQEVYRMPSVGSISSTIKVSCHLNEQIGRGTARAFPSIDPLDAFYLLNPSGDLEHTQAEFEEWFMDQKLEGRAGSGAAPSTEELVSALKDHDLFIYFGHGNGTQYISKDQIQKLHNCSATFLMGCSSGSLSYLGNYNPEGVVLSYLLAGSPVIVANLWDVTDKEIDKFGKSMLSAWVQERSADSSNNTLSISLADKFELVHVHDTKKNAKKKVARGRKQKEVIINSRNDISCSHRQMIGSFMSQARETCKLKYLTGAAPVCYGVPTFITKKKGL